MKNYIFPSALLTLFTFFSLSLTAAPKTINGFWKSFKKNVVIEVIRTRDGIKTKRTDQNKWYYYEKSKSTRFEDEEGNRFILDGKNLIWKSRNGKKTIKFRKVDELDSKDSNSDEEHFETRKDKRYYYDNDEDDSDEYYRHTDRNRNYDDDYSYRNRKYYSRKSYRKARRAKELEGPCFNYLTRKKIIIDARTTSIEVRLRGRWSRFHQTRVGRFINNRGDVIRTMSNGTLKYMSWNSAIPIYFEKKYRRHFYRR